MDGIKVACKKITVSCERRFMCFVKLVSSGGKGEKGAGGEGPGERGE